MDGTQAQPRFIPSGELFAFEDSRDPITVGLWSYVDWSDPTEELFREDLTVNENNFAVGEANQPERVAGQGSEYAAEFDYDDTDPIVTLPESLEPGDDFNAHTDPWAVSFSIYIGTPSEEGFILQAPGGKGKVWYHWDGAVLRFRQQIGTFAPDSDETEFYNEVAVSGLNNPINQNFIVTAAYRGPSRLAYPVSPVMMALQVDDVRNSIPAPCLGALTPPATTTVADSFIIGPITGQLGPIAIYWNRVLSDEDMDRLYNDGNGLAIIKLDSPAGSTKESV